MIKRFTFVFVLLFSIAANAQIILTQDTTICGTQNLTLQAFSGGSNGNSLFLTDDTHSPIVNIGFPFTFYGTTYTDLLISTNGYITFDLANAGLMSPWTNNAPVPMPGQIPENAILAPWHDIDPSVGGVIYEGVNGAAPNRVYVVTWCAIPMFSCNNMLATQQIKLHENSNKIEIFIQEKPLCLTWAGGTAIQGTISSGSTFFDIVNDPTLFLPRNWPLTWTATNEGWEFIPSPVGNSYTINSIPFQPIVAGTIDWFDNNWSQIGTGNSITVSPTTTTTYYASINRCDGGGTVIDSITITLASAINSQLTSNDASCFGNDATLTVTPDLNTTTPPWNIDLMDANGNVLQTQNNVWNNHIFTGLFPGTYTVNVIEPTTGCSGSNTLVVKQVHIDLALNAFSDNVSCFEGNDGYIAVYADSGYPPYQYFIDGILNTNPPPYDTAFFNNLTAGTYILSVMDTVNCMMRDTVTITDPPYPLQALAASKSTTCYGQSQGTAVVQGAGGTPPYSYNWYNAGQVSFSLNDSVSGLFSGTYYVEVTDANGCDTFTTVNVIQPQTPLTAAIQIMDVVCKGDSTGYIVATAGGSYAPYSYYWLSGPDTLQSASPPVNVTRDSLNNLPTGSYELHVYDAWGCMESYSNMVSEPTNPLSSTLNKIQDVDCYGDSTGSVQLIVNGGVLNYDYLWDNGETSSVATNLTAGLHTVWITDDWNCTIEDTISISENSLIEDSITVIQNVSCYGGTDGAVVISSYGGILPHSYDWSNGHLGTSQLDTNSGLLYGSYYVLIEDQLGCRVVDSVFISEPTVLETEATKVAHVTCYGFDNGIATAIGIGGTVPYTFNWTPGGQTSDTAFGLVPGVHTVNMMDSKGCTASDTVIITEPYQLTVNIVDSLTIHPYCTGISSAELTAVATGGTPGYTYLWDDNATIPQTTATATALAAGIYTITVTDSRTCVATDTTDISAYTHSMDAKIDTQLYAGGVQVSCFGTNDGMAIVSAWGAHAPYSYQWFGPNNYTATNDSIYNLFAGAYSVNIEDTNGCLITRYINLTEPETLQFTSYLSTDETCLGACDGTVSVEVKGGIMPYYGIATENTNSNVITAAILADTITFPNICSGNYTISISDVNNCQSTLIQGGNNQQTISTSIATMANIDDANAVHLTCYNVPTGAIAVLSPIAAPNYTYSWEDLTGHSYGTDTIAANLTAGTYVLFAHYSDSLGVYPGCTSTDSIILTQVSEIMINATVNDALCNGQSSGSITTAVGGGTPGYTYFWYPNSQTTANINNLSPGTYSVDVTDNNNCYKTDTFTVVQPTALQVSVVQNGNQLQSTVNGGTPNYSYQWSSGQTGLNIIANNPGAYTLTVTDANGCMAVSNTIIITAVEIIETTAFSIYPNPFKQETLLEFGDLKSVVSVKVLDVCGNALETYDLKNSEQFTIKRGSKASGIYFLEVKMDGQTHHKRVVIQ